MRKTLNIIILSLLLANGAYAQIARSGVSAANWFVGILLTPVEEDPKAFSRYSSLAM